MPRAAAVKTEPGKREQNRQRSRRKILQAALKLFAEKGFESTNVRDILRASGISTGAFYQNFETKNDIFNELVVETISVFRRQAAADRERFLSQPQLMHEQFLSIFRFFRQQPELMQFLARNTGTLRQLNSEGRLTILIRDMKTDFYRLLPEASARMPVELVTRALFGTIFEMILYSLTIPDEELPVIARQMATFFSGGIGRLILADRKQHS